MVEVGNTSRIKIKGLSIPEFRETVQQDHQRLAFGTGQYQVQLEPVHLPEGMLNLAIYLPDRREVFRNAHPFNYTLVLSVANYGFFA